MNNTGILTQREYLDRRMRYSFKEKGVNHES